MINNSFRGKPLEGGGGGTLIFYINVGLADFFGVTILKFSIFGGFQKKSLFLGVVSFIWIFFGGLLIN